MGTRSLALGVYAWVVIVLSPWVGFESHAEPSLLDWTLGAAALLVLLGGAVVPAFIRGTPPLSSRAWGVSGLLAFPSLLTLAAVRHEPSASSPTETVLYILLAASAVAGFVLQTADELRRNDTARETESRPYDGSLLSDAFRFRRRVAGAVALLGAALPAIVPFALGDTIGAHWPGAEREATLLLALVGAAVGASLLGHSLGQLLRRNRRDHSTREAWIRALPWLLLSAVAAMLGGVAHSVGQ